MEDSKGFSVAALVLGILSIVFIFVPGFPGWLALIMSVVGLILASMGMKRNPSGHPGHGMAVAGLVLCIISLVFTCFALVCVMGLCATVGAVGLGAL